MQHDLRLAGVAFGLRPVEFEDADFILQLRRDPELARYLHPVSPHITDQDAWLKKYFERAGDLYFVVVRRSTGRPEGTIALYDIQTSSTAEWGRWILRRDSMAGVESAWLIYRVAFDVLGLGSIYCRTVAANHRVVSFHASCGLSTRNDAALTVRFGEKTFDMIEQSLSSVEWKQVEGRLAARTTAVAEMLER